LFLILTLICFSASLSFSQDQAACNSDYNYAISLCDDTYAYELSQSHATFEYEFSFCQAGDFGCAQAALDDAQAIADAAATEHDACVAAAQQTLADCLCEATKTNLYPDNDGDGAGDAYADAVYDCP